MNLRHIFRGSFPSSRLTTGLPQRIFGCTTFVHVHNRSKLELRAKKCIFVGYALIQKGYKCYDPHASKIIVTMDLTFFESQLYFTTHLQGEYHVGEDSFFCDIEEIRYQEKNEPNITINTDGIDVGEDIDKCDPRDDKDQSNLNNKNSEIELEPIAPSNDKNQKMKIENKKQKCRCIRERIQLKKKGLKILSAAKNQSHNTLL